MFFQTILLRNYLKTNLELAYYYLKQWSKEKIFKNKALLFKAVLLAMISLSLITGPADQSSSPTSVSLNLDNLFDLKNETTFKMAELEFDPQNSQILVLKEKKVEIVLGESNFDREQRLAKEETEKLAKRSVIPRKIYIDGSGPSLLEKRALVQKIASKYGIPWQILEAVWQVESGKSWNTTKRSYRGATGPLQFLPSTFKKYAPSGASIYSASDSLEAAANLLASAGALDGQVERALYAYNHSYTYVKKALKIARELGY